MSDQPLVVSPGLRLASAVCSTEVVVVRASDSQSVIECGGAPMHAAGTPPTPDATPAAGLDGGSLIGKRYGGADAGAGGGIAGLRRRLSAFDGTLEISSPAGGPTRARMTVPCESL